MNEDQSPRIVRLPDPKCAGSISVEEALNRRRSVRNFSADAITLQDVSQLLWAAQGLTGENGLRTAPSAGALYPLELYIAAGNVKGLPGGIYHYRPIGHELIRIVEGDKRDMLCRAGLEQGAIKNAPAVIVLSAVFERTTGKYGKRGINYVFIEAGHAAQNICLQAVSNGLGTVVIGAFHDDDIKNIMMFNGEEHPVYIVPVGKPSK